MPSTFFGLQIAYSGLKASNAALNTTGNNIANVDTKGYSRQTVSTAAAESMRVFATYGCAGAGVDTLAIERVRDSFYDEKFRDNETRLGEYERKQYYMSIVETYFKDDGKTGFKSIFDDMMDAMEEVTKNGSSTSTKSAYVSSVKTLADYFNNMAGDLMDLQKDINDELRIQINQVNSIAEELATINKQINVIELTGTTANELRDKRDLLVDNLSQYLDVTVTETPIYNALEEPTGATRCIIKVAGGQTLVDQNEFRTLKCVAREKWENVYQSDADGLYDVYWDDGEKFTLDNKAMSGSIKGLADLRDGNNGNRFYGTIADVDTVTEMVNGKPVSNHVVTIETTADNLATVERNNIAQSGRIILGNQEYYYQDFSATYNPDGTATYVLKMDDLLCDMEVDAGKIGKEAVMGFNSEYQGIPYYMSQMNEWVRSFAKQINSVFTAGYTVEGEDAGILVSGNLATAKGQFTEDQLNETEVDDDGNPFKNGKGYYYITAHNFSVDNATNLNPDLLGSRAEKYNGVEECNNIYSVMDILRDKSKMSFRGYNASGFLESTLSDVSLNTSNARTFTETYTSLQTVLGNQRTSISGVDSDEEALNLVKYENAYTLAAKLISTFQEIYDRLILNTGV